MLKDIVKIFYKSDFTVQWELPEGYNGQDFRFTLFTNDDIEDGWTASYIGGTYKHCLVEDDHVTIYVDANHDMKAGCLTVQSEYDLGNNHFADGTETIKDRVKTNIYLVSIGANGTSATFIPSNRADLTGSGDFVTFSDLDAMSYVTSNELSQMSYVTISDLGDYLTQEEIEDMGFLTQAQLDAMGYATTDYIDSKDYATSAQVAMKQNLLVSGRNIKTVNGYSLLGQGNIDITDAGSIDLSSYVTHNELQSTLGSYVTKDELDSMGYITSSCLVDELADYTTNNDLALTLQGYVSYSQFNTYTSDFVVDNELQDYVTKSQLTSMSYVTETELSGMSYVSHTELNNASYVTESQLSASSYATTSQLSTKQDTLVSGTNIKTINNESILGSGNITIQGGGSAPGYSHALKFTAEQANSTIMMVRIGAIASLNDAVLQYSTDNGDTWDEYTLETTITLAAIGDSVMLKGTNTTLGVNGSNYHKFVMTGKISASGDVTSLFNETGGDMTMPAYGCYYLFFDCTSLVTAPKLPATTLAQHCYSYMFYGCTSLVTAPKLPATTLEENCYDSMFFGCKSLVTAPKLPATTLAEYCYFYMFAYCTSLVTPPKLPATTLAQHCYSYMFYECTSLVTAPELPATTLEEHCYNSMFYGCTSLVTAPELPATTVHYRCYYRMFANCIRLNYVKAMFISLSSDNAYTGDWLYNVSETGTFVKNNFATWTTTGENGVPTEWTVYKAVSIDTDDVPESYVEDEGKTLQVVNGLWTKVTSSGGSSISEVTQAEYDAMEQAGTLDPDTIYVITDAAPTELSYYVTKDELTAASYITNTELSNVLSTASYVTQNELSNAGYVTQTQLTQASYITNSTLSQASYVTQNELSNAGYVTQTQLTQASYITNSTLSQASYVTQNELSNAGYVTQTQLTQAEYDAMEQAGTLDPDTIYVITDAAPTELSYYVTKDELTAASYITNTELSNVLSTASYVTQQGLSGMGYLTSANFIYDSANNTLTISI